MEHRIKDLIKNKGYTQKEFADKLKITRGGLIQMLENPSGSSLEKIADALEVPIWQLFVSSDELHKKEPEDKNVFECPVCHTKFKKEE